MIPRRSFRAVVLSACLPLALGLPRAASAGPVAATLASGEVEISLSSDEDVVSLGRDFHLTITTTYPPGQEVVLPGLSELRGRFQGFSLAEGFRREPEKTPGGRMRTEDRWRLVPEPSARCRLAPFAVKVRPAGGSRDGARSFATAPVVFPVAELEPAAGDVEVEARPFRIAPAFRTVAGRVAVALLAVLLAAGVVLLLSRLNRAAKLRRMTPSERAFAELEALLSRRLPEKGLFKDFYIELTHVVRRYIERSHGIRAPEQTTEEFLAAARRHPRFTPEVIRSLSDFLRSADLVKFARRDASAATAGDAVRTARDYIATDTEATRRLDAGAPGKTRRGEGRP